MYKSSSPVARSEIFPLTNFPAVQRAKEKMRKRRATDSAAKDDLLQWLSLLKQADRVKCVGHLEQAGYLIRAVVVVEFSLGRKCRALVSLPVALIAVSSRVETS